jgi:hypothetical protein
MFAPHLDIRDLQQAGAIGLVNAANCYDPSRGDFERYSYFRVRGAIGLANAAALDPPAPAPRGVDSRERGESRPANKAIVAPELFDLPLDCSR